MTHLPSKKLWLFLISSVTVATLTVIACGGGDWDDTEGSMFTPQIINQETYTPFFRTMAYPFYDGYDDARADVFKDLNVSEWTTYFGNSISPKTMSYWLYKASLNQVDSMIFDLKGKASHLTEESKINTLKNIQPSSKATSFLYYLGFARRNEAFAVKEYENPWDEAPKKVSEFSITKQINGGSTFYAKTSDPFLKERYAFQLERLHFFNQDYDQAISFFNENESSFSVNTSMKWRSLGYKAASLYKQKKYAEANYIYSIIYDSYEPLKKSAYLSFHPQDQGDWNACLMLAKNTHEKEVLWQLFGLYNDGVLAMKEILKLNPKSELADLLLVRAVNAEESKMSLYAENDSKDPVSANKNLLAFLNTMSESSLSKNPAIWHLSAAYLNYLQKDYVIADAQMKRATKYLNTSPLIKSQYHVINLVGKLTRVKETNEALEKDLLPDLTVLMSEETSQLKDFRSQYAITWVRQTLAKLYSKKNAFETSELIFPGTTANYFHQTEAIKKMIAYYEKGNASAFEKLFFSHALLSKNNYTELLAIRLAQQDKLDESLTVFKTLSETETLPGNPFTIHIRDCHDCDHEAIQKTKYTKTSFIEKMIDMKKTALSKPNEATQNYFLIANGFYNMTYFGNARLFYDNRVDNSIYQYEHPETPEENNDLALKYYLLALQNATDREFKAKCTFMAAKCEQNAFFMNIPKNFEGDFKSGIYFASLKKEYASTKYYAEIIKECGYFKTYLGR